MKYKDILEDILAGKLARQSHDHPWMKMKENGTWDLEDGFIPDKIAYSLDTWEIKPDEVNYIYGVSLGTDEEGYDSYLMVNEKFDLNPDTFPISINPGTAILVSSGRRTPDFALMKPRKYKIIPVDEFKEKYGMDINEWSLFIKEKKECFERGKTDMFVKFRDKINETGNFTIKGWKWAKQILSELDPKQC